ncbi:hypothetical protein [Streptomyces anthocyanicus]|uniref:hypothetical protein n=1 Tax=Streptomyces anthocyanicus TaxID=68174 RepID=UPI003824D5A0
MTDQTTDQTTLLALTDLLGTLASSLTHPGRRLAALWAVDSLRRIAAETDPDFFQPGRTYTSGTASTLPPAPQWTFQVTTVAESPRGERVALGFLTGATYGCGVWTPHGEHDMAGWTAAGARQDGAQQS